VTAGPGPDELTPAQWLYLFTRADTIYGGSSEVQRNVVAQRMLGLPRGPV
jgi:alkylation response protein AidB-like acyl-CoA dehydrogenase